MGATVVEGEPQGGGPSHKSSIGCQTEIMIQSLLDKVQGPKKDKLLLGMKVWLQYQPKMGQLPQLSGSILSAEEVKEAAAFPPLMDDGWMSFMFSMIRRLVSDENARAEHWATVLHFKEQALIEEAKAKLNLLSCQQRCGQEAGSGPPAESFDVAFQLMHQQAQMKKLVQATQAAAEDRTLILKHLADIETQRGLTIQLQNQAKAFQKVQDEKELIGSGTPVECGGSVGNSAAMELSSDKNQCLKVAMGEHHDTVEKSQVTLNNWDDLSAKELHKLIVTKHNELEETVQKASARLIQRTKPEADAEAKSVDAYGLSNAIEAQPMEQRAEFPTLPPESGCITSAPTLLDGLDHDASPEDITDSLTQSDEGPSDDKVLDQAIEVIMAHHEVQDDKVMKMPNVTVKVTPAHDACLDVAKQGNQDMMESSDDEVLDQAMKVLPAGQVEKVMVRVPNIILKVSPDQDPCLDAANQGSQDKVGKSSGTLNNLVESVTEHSPGMSISPIDMFYYTSEDSDSEDSLSDILKGKVVSSECPSLKGEVASSDATVLLCAQEDSESHYEEDFEVLSDEMELEYSGKACLSFSSDDDSAESLLTNTAESDVKEMVQENPQEAPSVSDQSEWASDKQAGPSKLRDQETSAQNTKAGQEGSEAAAAAATLTRQLQVEAKETLHHPAKVEMLVHHAVQEIWQVFDLGQGPKDLSSVPCPKPSENYLKMAHLGQPDNTVDKHSYNKLIFHLSWETLQDLCAKDPTTQPIWRKNQPERHNYVEKLKSFDLSKVKEYITEEVFKHCGLMEEKDAAMYGRVFAYNYQGFNLTKFDQILLREMPEEEHKWLDQDQEAFDVKNKYANVVFDYLLDDTLKCLLGHAKKGTKKS